MAAVHMVIGSRLRADRIDNDLLEQAEAAGISTVRYAANSYGDSWFFFMHGRIICATSEGISRSNAQVSYPELIHSGRVILERFLSPHDLWDECTFGIWTFATEE